MLEGLAEHVDMHSIHIYTGARDYWTNVLQPHKAESVTHAVEAAKARVIRLPSSSPDLTPIEEMFSKAKDVVRSIAARTTGAVYAAFASGLHDVTLEDIAGWFGDRAAYAMQL